MTAADSPYMTSNALDFLRSNLGANGSLQRVHKSHLYPAPNQPRRSFDKAALEELRISMEEQQQQPIIAYRADAKGSMAIRVGERRWRAAGLSEKIQELDVIELPYSHEEEPTISRLIAQASENVHREPLNLIDWALTVEQLVDMMGDRKQVAEAIGKDLPYISRLLSILNAPPLVRKLAQDNIVTDAKTLALLRRAYELDEEKTTDLINRAVAGTTIEGGLRSEAEAIIKLTPSRRRGSTLKPSFARPVTADALQIRQQQGKVTLQVKRGAEVLQYRVTKAQLDDLIEAMNGVSESEETA